MIYSVRAIADLSSNLIWIDIGAPECVNDFGTLFCRIQGYVDIGHLVSQKDSVAKEGEEKGLFDLKARVLEVVQHAKVLGNCLYH